MWFCFATCTLTLSQGTQVCSVCGIPLDLASATTLTHTLRPLHIVCYDAVCCLQACFVAHSYGRLAAAVVSAIVETFGAGLAQENQAPPCLQLSLRHWCSQHRFPFGCLPMLLIQVPSSQSCGLRIDTAVGACAGLPMQFACWRKRTRVFTSPPFLASVACRHLHCQLHRQAAPQAHARLRVD